MVPGHGVAQDHRGALAVERPLGIAVVEQRLPSRRHRPLLGPVHGGVDLGRDRQSPLERLPLVVLYPAADLGVGLVGSLGVRVPVELGVPPLARHLADAVATLFAVGPEGGGIRGVGEDRSNADNGNRPWCKRCHGFVS